MPIPVAFWPEGGTQEREIVAVYGKHVPQCPSKGNISGGGGARERRRRKALGGVGYAPLENFELQL